MCHLINIKKHALQGVNRLLTTDKKTYIKKKWDKTIHLFWFCFLSYWYSSVVYQIKSATASECHNKNLEREQNWPCSPDERTVLGVICYMYEEEDAFLQVCYTATWRSIRRLASRVSEDVHVSLHLGSYCSFRTIRERVSLWVGTDTTKLWRQWGKMCI